MKPRSMLVTNVRSAASPGVRVEARSRGERASARRRDEQGQALLEFAFVMPILLILVFGVFVFGIALNNYLVLTNATSISSQLLAISRGQTTDPCNTTAQAFYAAAPNLTHGNLTFTIVLDGTASGGVVNGTTVYGPGSTPACSSSSTTTGAAADLVSGTAAQVTVAYPCNLNVFGFNFAPQGCTLTAKNAEVVQ